MGFGSPVLQTRAEASEGYEIQSLGSHIVDAQLELLKGLGSGMAPINSF